MRTKRNNQSHIGNFVAKGFTLVELLIVVIILAILAAIVVPQFASTTDDANLAALDSNLANVRAAIDLYKQQHGAYPGEKAASNTANVLTACTPVSSGAVNSEASFLEQLSRYTSAGGGTCNVKSADYRFGPYMQKTTLPTNPYTGLTGVEISTVGSLDVSANATPTKGWKMDVISGRFIANDGSTPTGQTISNDDR